MPIVLRDSIVTQLGHDMQGIHTALFAGLLVAGGIFAGVATRDEATSVDPAVTASVGNETVFRLAARGAGGHCRFAVSEAEDDAPAVISLGAGCRELAPDLAAAAAWSADGDGNLTVSDAGGATLVRFMPGDGIAFVSRDYGAPRFTLESAD